MHPSSQQTRSGRIINPPQWRREVEVLAQTLPVPAARGRTEILDDPSGGDVDRQSGAVDISEAGDAAADYVGDAAGEAAGDAMVEAAVVVAGDAAGEVVNQKIDNAIWGAMKGQDLADSVNNAYLEVVRWRRNLFNLPTGKAGEDFIDELTKLYCHFNDSTAFKSIALTLSAIIFPLLLQKPAPTSKSRDHVRYLQKRILLWRTGKLDELLSEGRAIQNRFSKKKKSRQVKQQSRFITLMEQGKCLLLFDALVARKRQFWM